MTRHGNSHGLCSKKTYLDYKAESWLTVAETIKVYTIKISLLEGSEAVELI